MDFNKSTMVYNCPIIKERRLIEGVITDSVKIEKENKYFSKVDAIKHKIILMEAKLTNLINSHKHRL